MKRHLFILSMILCMIILVACGEEPSENETDFSPSLHATVNDLPGVSMIVKEDTISPLGLTVVFANESDEELLYGDEYFLEVKIANKWYEVTIQQDDYGFDAIGYGLQADDKAEMKIDWRWIYGELVAGEYHLIKSITESKGMGNSDEYFLAAPFTIE